MLLEAVSNRRKYKLTVTSRSMVPLLQPGDEVIVEPFNPSQLRQGDMVVIRSSSDLVIHRVITIDQNGCVHTKGDNLPFKDPPVSAADILGLVTKVEKNQKTLDLSTPRWITLNRLLGIIGTWESKTLDYGRKLKSFLKPKKVEQDLATEIDRLPKRSNPTFIGNFVSLPFHSLTKLLIAFSQRISR
jgi:signal peptidase I